MPVRLWACTARTVTSISVQVKTIFFIVQIRIFVTYYVYTKKFFYLVLQMIKRQTPGGEASIPAILGYIEQCEASNGSC